MLGSWSYDEKVVLGHLEAVLARVPFFLLLVHSIPLAWQLAVSYFSCQPLVSPVVKKEKNRRLFLLHQTEAQFLTVPTPPGSPDGQLPQEFTRLYQDSPEYHILAAGRALSDHYPRYSSQTIEKLSRN